MTSLPSERSTGTWRVGTLSYTTGGLVLLFVWLLAGDFAWSMRDRAVPPVMQVLFKRFGASDLLTGVIFSSLPSAFSLLIGPLVAYKSDRLRTRWGRRIPFLILPVPLIVASLVGLAFCPALGVHLSHLLGTISPGVNASILIVMASCWILFDVGCVSGNAVFGALVNDVVPAAVIGRFFGLFRAVGLLAGIFFFLNLMGKAEAHSMWLFLGIAVLYGIGFSVMCLKVKEGRYETPPEETGEKPGWFDAVKTYFKDGFGNPYYLWYFAALTLGILSSLPFNLYSFFYAGTVGVGADAYGKCIALTYTCSLLLSYPLGMLADRFHPLRVCMVGLALYAVVMGAGGLMVHDAATFSVILVIHGVVSGSLLTAWASLPQRILPRAKFAEMSSVAAIVVNLSIMIVAPAVGKGLDYFHHAYRYTFPACVVLTLLALGAFAVLYRRFLTHGGPEHYVAPES